MYFVYILYSKQFDRYYIGQTNDILQRINIHNSAKVPSTASYIPWEPIGYIEKENRSQAMILEKKLKNLNQTDLRKFIRKHLPAKIHL